MIRLRPTFHMNKPRSLLACLIAVGWSAAALAAREATSSAMLSLVKDSRPTAVIVYPRSDALALRTAEKLARYLEEQTGARLSAFAEDEFKPVAKEVAVIVLDSTNDHRLAKAFGVPIQLSAEHPDAYQIKVTTAPSPRVILAGKTASGVKFAAYRLMLELAIDRGQARVGTRDVSAEPFFKTRSVALFNVWNMPIEVTRRHNVESW